jgi:hypothetical protein
MNTKFPLGTFKRIADVLQEGETRMDFVRRTALAELDRREIAQKQKPRAKGRKS